jgi:predicted Fe-Mo cluster-binding NifX family protein
LKEIDDQKKQGNVVKIAITCFGEEIAPCFAATKRFRIWELGPDNKINCGELAIDEIGGLARIRLLKQSGINVLICNGIEGQARQLLETGGCRVVESIVGSAADALYGYLAGKIPDDKISKTVEPNQLQPHTADLVKWTQELFISLGWTVERFNQSEAYPIDLRATIQCPVCSKPVRVAICCGAHTYRVESEIQEFGHITAREYHSRVYVHHAMSNIVEWCHDYEIELLDPISFSTSAVSRPNRKQLPPLRCRIKDHEKINIEQPENKQ